MSISLSPLKNTDKIGLKVEIIKVIEELNEILGL